MIGFDDIEEAREAYLKHYPDPRILGEIRRRPMDSFRMLVRKIRGEEGPKKMASIKCASDHSLILALEADRLGTSDDLEKLANVMRAVRAAKFPTSAAKSRIPSTTTAASGATAPKTTAPKPLNTRTTTPPTPAVQRPVGAPQPPAAQAQAAGVPARSPASAPATTASAPAVQTRPATNTAPTPVGANTRFASAPATTPAVSASAPATTASAPAVQTQSVPNPTPTTAPNPSPVGANAGATSAPATAPAVSASAPAVPTQSVPNPTPSPVGANAGATSSPATAPAVSASAPAVPEYTSASEYLNHVKRVRSIGDDEIWENILKQNPNLRTISPGRRRDEIEAVRRSMMPAAPKNDLEIERLLTADDPNFPNLPIKEKIRRIARWKTEAGLREASKPTPAQTQTSGATPKQPSQPAQPAGTDPAAPAASLGIPWGKLVGLTALGTGTYAAYRGIDAAANLAGGAHNFGPYSGPVHPSMNPNAYYSGGPGYL